MADAAWKEVTPATVTNCFQHADILSRRDPITGKPFKPNTIDLPPPPRSEDADLHAVELALEANIEECIRDAKVLAPSNKVSVANLLTPEGEDEGLQQWFSDEALLECVQTGGDGTAQSEDEDGADESDEPVSQPHWSCKQLIEASLQLERTALERRGSSTFQRLSHLLPVALRELRREEQNSKVQSTLESWLKTKNTESSKSKQNYRIHRQWQILAW